MFFIIPVGVDYDARRYPVVTFTLMGLCTAIWLVTLLCRIQYGPEVDQWVFQNLWLIPNRSGLMAYLTTMFVHGGFLHLVGNMIYLFLFGSCVEDLIGRGRFLVFYLLGGLLASWAQILVSPAHFSSAIPIGGASGAISACIGGFVLFLWKTRIEFKWVFLFFVRLFSGEFFVPAWLVISFWYGADLLGAVMSMSSTEETGGVAFGAHVGGFLAGLAMISLEKARLKREEHRAEENVTAHLPAMPANILLFMNGQQCGPFTDHQVQDMIRLGSVPADALYWRDGLEDWRSIQEISG